MLAHNRLTVVDQTHTLMNNTHTHAAKRTILEAEPIAYTDTRYIFFPPIRQMCTESAKLRQHAKYTFHFISSVYDSRPNPSG